MPRTGFERNNEAELVTSFRELVSNQRSTQFRRSYRALRLLRSVNGNRSNYGLQTPIGQVFHDAENGYGGFASFIFNPDSKNQFRLVTSLRQDYYQIPYDPNPNSIGNQQLAAAGNSPSYGLRDGEHERDGYVTFSWVHTFNPTMLLTVSPFYHYNSADYQGGANDYPVISTMNQAANYGGLQATLNENRLEKRCSGRSVRIRSAPVQLLR